MKWLLSGCNINSGYHVSTMFEELELYKPELVSKPAILILNKIDIKGAEKLRDETVEKVKRMRGSHGHSVLLRLFNCVLFSIVFSTQPYLQLKYEYKYK